MKRTGNLYQLICSKENLVQAEKKARKGKRRQYGVKLFDRNPERNIDEIHDALVNKTFRTSPYKYFQVIEKKVRDICCLPYKDRIVHHAIMIPLEEIFVRCFTADTFSCIKGRGIMGFFRNFRKALRNDVAGTVYYMQMDIRKFYASIDHAILKSQLRRKIKDQDLLWLLDGIIDSSPGVPIGNYLSQYFANFYLSGFDHWVKEELGVDHYFRYSDDMVILASTKEELHRLKHKIIAYLSGQLNLTLKPNVRIALVSTGVNVIGYIFRKEYTKLRPEIKRGFAREMARKYPRWEVIAAYLGWAKHADCKHLINKLWKRAA